MVLLYEIIRISFFTTSPILQFYSAPKDDYDQLQEVFGPIVLLCFFPECLTLICSGTLRACALWRNGTKVRIYELTDDGF